MKPQAKRLIIISVLALGGAAIWYFFIKGKPPKGNNQNTGNASDTRTNWSDNF